MSLKEKLQKISKRNDSAGNLFNQFIEGIESYLRITAGTGKTEARLNERYYSIIKDIEIWTKNNDLVLRSFTEGHAQNTCYAISWKD